MKFSRPQVEQALEAVGWEITAAARRLGTTRQTLYTLMGRYALSRPESVSSTVRVKYSRMDSSSRLTQERTEAHVGSVSSEPAVIDEAPEPSYRMNFFLPARHREWLKRRALERQLARGGHDSVSEVVMEILDREIERGTK